MSQDALFLYAIDRLGIDHNEEEELIDIAHEMSEAKLPQSYEIARSVNESSGDEVIYFYNHERKESSWDHPLLKQYIEKVESARKGMKKGILDDTTSSAIDPDDQGDKGDSDIVSKVVVIRALNEQSGGIPIDAVDYVEAVEFRDDVEEESSLSSHPLRDAGGDDCCSNSSAKENNITSLLDDGTPFSLPTESGGAKVKEEGRVTISKPDTLVSPFSEDVLRFDSRLETIFEGLQSADSDSLKDSSSSESSLCERGDSSKLAVHDGEADLNVTKDNNSCSADLNLMKDEVMAANLARDNASFELKVANMHHLDEVDAIKRELDVVKRDSSRRIRQLETEISVKENEKETALARIEALEDELQKERNKKDANSQQIAEPDPTATDCCGETFNEGEVKNIEELVESNKLLSERIVCLEKENSELHLRIDTADKENIADIVAIKQQILVLRKKCRQFTENKGRNISL